MGLSLDSAVCQRAYEMKGDSLQLPLAQGAWQLLSVWALILVHMGHGAGLEKRLTSAASRAGCMAADPSAGAGGNMVCSLPRMSASSLTTVSLPLWKVGSMSTSIWAAQEGRNTSGCSTGHCFRSPCGFQILVWDRAVLLQIKH